MKFTPAQIRELAENARFPAENLEKVLRLRELLTEFHRHTILKGQLVLKGGTALNLFYLNLARLSVDIDLNYIGHIDREATLKDRPEIVKALEQIAAGLGYQLQHGVDDYALREWHLNFKNHAGRSAPEYRVFCCTRNYTVHMPAPFTREKSIPRFRLC